MIYPNLESAMQDVVKEVEKAAEKTLQDAGEFARQEAINTDLFKVSSSFKAHTQFHTLDKLNGFVLADMPHAQYLEFGNNEKGPFIRPVNAKALHFVVGGRDVFTKKVRSHGPLPFMANAGDKLDSEIENIFNRNLEASIKD
jgi:hypothetical protein